MDLQALGNWLSQEGVATGEDQQLDFSDCSLIWDWPCDYVMDADRLESHIPLQVLPPDPLPPCPDLLQEFYTAFDSENGLICGGGGSAVDDAPGDENACDDQERKDDQEMAAAAAEGGGGGGGSGSEVIRAITFEEVSRYFYVPITQAAKELNVGLTQLKKKCRELGIPRWPHRKMKSLQALIKNVQDLRRDEGEMGEAQLRQAIDILEREREAMERMPGTKLEEKTKRLRQACFKANFKKRRLHVADGEGDRAPDAMAAAAARAMVRQQLREEDEEEEATTTTGRFLRLPAPVCRKKNSAAVTVKPYGC